MKLTIYIGTPDPLKAVGVNQCRLLDFAFRYPCWHTAATDRATVAALSALVKRGAIILNQYGQFKININTARPPT